MDVFQSRRTRNDQSRNVGESLRGRGGGGGSDIGSNSRDHGASGRRSRSRDRSSRDLPKSSRRTRSRSPPQSEYSKVHDRWKKFKQSQRVSTYYHYSYFIYCQIELSGAYGSPVRSFLERLCYHDHVYFSFSVNRFSH